MKKVSESTAAHNEEKKSRKKNRKKRNIGIKVCTVLAVFFVFLAFFVICSANWVLTTWNGLTMDEVIYHIKAPLTGTGAGMIGQYIRTGVLPALIALAAAIAVLVLLRKKKRAYKLLLILMIVGGLIGTAAGVYRFWTKLDIGSYIKSRFDKSTFIEDNYVDPSKTTLTFPEKKRNLIYIYLESMEDTYSDKADGGGFDEDTIPELTQLAQENEDFSGNTNELDGARVYTGSTYTMAAIFSQSTGLPLQVNLSDDFTDARGSFNKMDTQDSFFSSVTALGDILEDEGYSNNFLLGSDVTFGGRKLFFKDHGDFDIEDYNYAIENGLIPSNYKVWWGFEDEKLFQFAKDKLDELSQSDQPFNLTLLTVDTHFEDGYVCDLCQDDFPGNQYANVMACSSRQIASFIEWAKQQDWYDNTTIILNGDHLTMDTDFCDNVDPSYERRTYTCYINSAVTPEDPDRRRDYSTFDCFPTTLAALGVEIDGDRLGLGTNLFSDTDTLTEEYGYDYVNEEMGKRSEFMDSLSDLNLYDEDLMREEGLAPEGTIEVTDADPDTGELSLKINNIDNVYEEVKSLNVEITDESTARSITAELSKTSSDDSDDISKAVYSGTIDTSDVNMRDAKLTATIVGKSGAEYELGYLEGDLSLKTRNIYDYLTALSNNRQYDIFIGVKDEASRSLNQAIIDGMRNLGLAFDLQGHYRYAYYAVLTQDADPIEEMSADVLSYSGTLADGTQYDLISQGGNAGKYNSCSIKIDGTDYAINKIGLNFVVYDHDTGKVVDSVEFNTYAGLGATRLEQES